MFPQPVSNRTGSTVGLEYSRLWLARVESGLGHGQARAKREAEADGGHAGYPAAAAAAPTRMIRKILRAAVTEAWIFLICPGSLAHRNMQAYCTGAQRQGQHTVGQQHSGVGLCASRLSGR